MTAHRHFGDTAEFAAAVERLADPLNDPLPASSRLAARPAQERGTEQPAEQPAERAELSTTPPLPAQPVASPAPVPGRQPYERDLHRSAGPAWEPQPAGPWPAPPTAAATRTPMPAPVPAPEGPAEPGTGYGGPPEPAEPAHAEGVRAARRPLTEEERAAARRRIAGAPGDTMAMPVVAEPEPERDPDHNRQLDRDRERDRDLAEDPSRDPDGETPRTSPGPSAPEGGGRAARRKAAQEAARRGGRGRRRSGAPADPRAATDAATAPLASTPAAPRSRVEARRAARAAKESPAVLASRVAGEVFITLGVLMLLFVSYQLWWTNVLAHQQAGGAANNLRKQWDGEKDPKRDPGAFTPGQGFAIMYIPKLDVKAPIAEGVDKHKVLDKGMIGHYSGALETAMPWDKQGNFALAAHRNTHGEPFRYVNKLVAGDKVVVETESTYYTYEVTSMLPSTPPSNISVIKPIPHGSGFTKPGRYLTLTTCTPEFTSEYRLIVWGKMVEERPRSKGKPDALVG
ncbi:class E sortase [Streptomyces sp. ME02-6991-2B]|nr:class E sortase [Streptomyces sp. ME02-6991-2B]